jgi:glycosyltransferase involved in cell wall biosynthesis
MKILHVTTVGEKQVFSGEARELDGGGGLGTCVFLFTRDADFRRTHDLQFTAVADGLFREKAERLGIPCHLLRCFWVSLFGRPLYLRFDQREIAKLIQSGNFDLIHAHNFQAVLAVGQAAKRYGIPVVCTVHQDVEEYVSQSSNPLMRMFSRLRAALVMHYYKRSMRFCDCFVAVSESVRRSLRRHGFRDETITVIKNCIQVDEPTGDPTVRQFADHYGLRNKTVVGTAIRLHSCNCVHLLLEAFRMLHAEYPSTFLLIIGGGPELQYLEKMALDMGIVECCAFPGFLSPISDYLPSLDVYVLPAATAGLPMAMLEAMYLGIPVVVADVGGVAEVVEHMRNGILVPGGSAEMIVSGVRKLLVNDDLRARIGTQGKQDVRRSYSLDRYLNAYSRVYLDALLAG